MKIFVNTDGKIINNTEATIQFPVDMLEVISTTKSSSIFSLWVEELNFSNKTGIITLNGGIPDPGYIGQSGYIATVTFKAKKAGTASVIFTDGAVRENDGLGTNILSSKSNGIIEIISPKVVENPIITSPKEEKDNSIIPKPIIFSDTHPNQDIWYSNSTASFSWKIPNGVTSLKTLFNKKIDSTPTISYDNSVTQKTLNNLSDGISYFHLKYFNKEGSSTIANYKIKVDRTAPLPFAVQVKTENGNNLIKLNANDSVSGIDYYTISIDGSAPIKINKDYIINNEYTLPPEKEGDHDLAVVAYDKASNHTESRTVFTSLSFTIPLISLNTKEITVGNSVTILGKTDYPNKNVNVILLSNDKEIGNYSQVVASDGTFSVTTDTIKTVGSVSIYAVTVFSDTIKSHPSEKIYLNVKEMAVVKVTLAIIYPLIGLLFIVIIILLIFILLYAGWHKYFGLKKKIEADSKQVIVEAHNAMKLLKEELANQLEILERVKVDRNLNDKEEKIFNEINKNIEGVDDFIEKKLKKLI